MPSLPQMRLVPIVFLVVCLYLLDHDISQILNSDLFKKFSRKKLATDDLGLTSLAWHNVPNLNAQGKITKSLDFQRLYYFPNFSI